MTLIERVCATIERFAMFARGMRVGVAVSGGADSVCLLEALRELAATGDWRLTVVHLDHGLRGAESDGDAAFVRDLAARHGLPLLLERANPADQGGNLEQAGREARLALFRRAIAAGTVDRVATGHTRSDQAETVLFRFLRGAGTAGLAGIRPVAGGVVRPLLEVGREEAEEWLRSRGLAWRDDSSNRSREFARNRIRHDLLPQLEREWNPQVRETMARTAEWARGEEEYWEEQVDRLAAEVLRPVARGILLDTAVVEGLPRALARRLLRRAVERVKGDLRGIELAHIDALLGLALAGEGHARTQAPGVDAIRSFEWMRLGVPGGEGERGFRVPLAVPGATAIPATGSLVYAEIIEKSETRAHDECVYNGVMGCLDWERVAGPLEMRNWCRGDRYRPTGHGGEYKIKALFQQGRVPLWERRHWPVITAGDTVVWSRRFGVAADWAAAPDAKIVLRIREHQGIAPGWDGV